MFPRRTANRQQAQDDGAAASPSADVSKLIETSLSYSHAIAAEVMRGSSLPTLRKKTFRDGPN